MENNLTSTINWDVIAQLYRLLLKQNQRNPGSREAEITEHAIDLVLNRKEPSPKQEYLFYNALKNAEFSKRRSYQRQYNFLRQISKQTKNNFHNQTPESYYVCEEIYSTITKRINAINPSWIRCLEGMLIKESISETAIACGISHRSVNRARKHIRKIACDCFTSYDLN